jgi:hypothetical protein
VSDPRTLACLVLLLACPGAALAAADGADIPDPLRPPSQLAAHAAPADAAALAPVRLWGTRIGPDGSFALIDGATVRAGDRLGDAVVIRIEAAAVTLRSDDGSERILRFETPGMIKRPRGHNGTQP